MADPEIKIKRYADKENLKKLMKYSKDTFATQSEVNEKFYTKEQIDTMLESGSGGGGGTGGGSEVGDATIKINYGNTNLGSFTTNQSADAIVDIRPINTLIGENYYTKKQIDILLKKVIVNQQVLGGAIYNPDIDEYSNETEQTMKTVSAVVEPTSVNAYTIVENSDTVEEL
jgi:hypothetical protein